MNAAALSLEENTSVVRLESYAPDVVTPASLLFGQPAGLNQVAMESFTKFSDGLLEDLGIRKDSIVFTIKETGTGFKSMFSNDITLNLKLKKVPFTTLMDLNILNPMGLKCSLLEYGQVLLAGTQLSKHILVETLPQAKVFYAEVIGNNELGNARPIPALSDLRLNTEEIAALKLSIQKMLDSKYENPMVSFGTHFKRIKDWEDTISVTEQIAKNIKELQKIDLHGKLKSILPLIDKLLVRVMQKGEDNKISDVNVTILKEVTKNLADEVAFLGAMIHLADTYVRVMEENKEQLRNYLT